jgi:hypothetical protein
MQTFATKKAVIAYAKQMDWTGADIDRAFKGLKAPVDEMTVLNLMVRFAGPELLTRQKLQAAQKAQVTVKEKRVAELSQNFQEMVVDYEQQMQDERSSFVALVELLYGFAQKFGYQDDWIDTLIKTYKQHSQAQAPKKNAA